jgi:diketogulonate reductase-like aldo/keto reductase
MYTDEMPAIPLPSGTSIPVLGQGTWHVAEVPELRMAEIRALRVGVEIGMTLIDTAEMYADGETERLVGEALAGIRDEAFLVSKVLPRHATIRGTVAACEASLRRLGTDHLDLYLLHWRGPVPLIETVAAFEQLVGSSKIGHWGVSNFDLSDMEELLAVPGGENVQTDQVLYNLMRRGIEWDLLPWSVGNGIPVMAYSPVERGDLLSHPAVRGVAQRHDVTPAQVALAWVLQHDLVSAIPKAGTPAHVREDRAAVAIDLTETDLFELDQAFPPPFSKRPLEML